MTSSLRRTKIVATIGPASSSPAVMRQLVQAGMDVARFNFSHGSHEEHARNLANLHSISSELDTPVTILQDLQGPKVRVGELHGGQITLQPGEIVTLVPEAEYHHEPSTIPLDYARVAEEAGPGVRVLLADGLFELEVLNVVAHALRCRVIEGGVLKSRKGVNFPNLHLPVPSV